MLFLYIRQTDLFGFIYKPMRLAKKQCGTALLLSKQKELDFIIITK